MANGRYMLVGLAVLTALWAWAGLGSRVWLQRTPLDWPWAIWLLMIPVTLAVTALPELTRPALAAFVAQAIAFWTVVTWTQTPDRARWMAFGLVLAAATLAVLTPFWVQWTSRLFAVPQLLQTLSLRIPLPLQEVVNRNIMAGVLVALWPLTLALVGASRGRRPVQIFSAAIALLALAILLLIQSRGAWIALAWAGFAFLAFRWRLAWVGLGLLGLLAVLMAWQGSLTAVLSSALQTDSLAGLDGRLELWSRALYAMQDFPLTGIGMGAFSRVIPLLYPFFLHGANADLPHAHNLFLQVGVDLGFVGLVSFLAMILATALLTWRAWLRLQQAGQEELGWLLQGSAISVSVVLVHGLVDATTWNTRPAFLAWAVWGLAASLGVLAHQVALRPPCPDPGPVLE